MQLLRGYQQRDPSVSAFLIYAGDPPDDALRQRAIQQRIRLRSYMEYQGLLDFRPYVERQTRRLAASEDYPPALYIEQRLKIDQGAGEQRPDDALAQVMQWIAEPQARFILLLGEFGTGKTFLLRELARRLGEQPDGPTPLLLEMRSLEKSGNLDKLVAQQLVGDGADFSARKFHYMLAQGRIVLLFDGYDELALRVTYDKAVEHFDTLLQAARGEHAKVIVTSRTQHFLTDRQIKQRLLLHAETMSQRRIGFLQPFNRSQIHAFLLRFLGDQAAADRRLGLIDAVRDLMGLSANPRMLSFIAALPDADLYQARVGRSPITAARLYETLLTRWLEGEQARVSAGFKDELTVANRWQAVTALALRLWQQTAASVDVETIEATVRENLDLMLEVKIAVQQIGSGTLLRRDEDGGFSFIHQSVMEWLVARHAAQTLAEHEYIDADQPLASREISPLMADFFKDLAGAETAAHWADAVLADDRAGSAARANALLLRQRVAAVADRVLKLRGENLRGKDFTDQDLSGADLSDTDLTDALLVGCRLQGANLSDAILINADLSRADLRHADLRRADATRARLLGADLTDARLDGCRLQQAALLGAALPPGLAADTFGAAMPGEQRLSAQHARWSGWQIAISGNGLLAALEAGNRRVSLWDAKARRCLYQVALGNVSARELALIPDGRWLVLNCGDDLRLLDVERKTLSVLRARDERWCSAIAVSPDSALLGLAMSDGVVELWRIPDRKDVQRIQTSIHSPSCIAFSPDGKRIAVAGHDGDCKLWDLVRGEVDRDLTFYSMSDDVRSIAFSPDGRRLVAGFRVETREDIYTRREGSARLFDTETGRLLHTLHGHQAPIDQVAFSPDGDWIATLEGESTAQVRLWNAERGTLQQTIGDSCTSIAFDHDGLWIGRASGVSLLDPKGSTQLELSAWRRTVRQLTFRSDGRLLVALRAGPRLLEWSMKSGAMDSRELEGGFGWQVPGGDSRWLIAQQQQGRLGVWDFQHDFAWKPRFAVRTRTLRRVYISMAAVSPDGHWIAVGEQEKGTDDSVRLLDVRQNKMVRRFKLEPRRLLRRRYRYARLGAIAISPNGRWLAAASSKDFDEGALHIWELPGGHVAYRQDRQTSAFGTLAFSPDGNRLAYSSHGAIQILDVEHGETVDIKTTERTSASDLVFSPHGRLLVSGYADGELRLFDLDSQEQILAFGDDSVGARSPAFSPDGRLLACASADGDVQLWEVASGRLLATLVELENGWVSYRPDGRYRCGGDIDGGFWHLVGLHRFEVGELDDWWPTPLRLAENEPLVPLASTDTDDPGNRGSRG